MLNGALVLLELEALLIGGLCVLPSEPWVIHQPEVPCSVRALIRIESKVVRDLRHNHLRTLSNVKPVADRSKFPLVSNYVESWAVFLVMSEAD